MNEEIIQDKIACAKKLAEKFSQIPKNRLTLIHTPPGYGKTTYVKLWASRLNNANIIWLDVDKDDNSLKDLFLQVAERIKDNSSKKLSNNIVKILSNEELIEENFFIVIDNYHNIRSKDEIKFLSQMIEKSSRKIHFIIISTGIPEIQKSDLRLKSDVLEIIYTDFTFNWKEIVSLFNYTLNIKINKKQAKIIQRETDGWITGILLIGKYLRDKNLKLSSTNVIRNYQYVEEYFEEKIFDKLSDKEKTFLLKFAFYEELELKDLVSLFPSDESNSIITKLLSKELFLFQLEPEKYRLHRLFSNFLRNKVKRNNFKEYQKLLMESSDWFLKRGDYSRSAEHIGLTEDSEKISEFLIKNFDRIISTGDIQCLRNLVIKIDNDTLKKQPIMYLYRAILSLYMGESKEDIIDNLEKVKLLPTFKTIEREYLAVLSLIYLYAENYKESIKYANIVDEKSSQISLFLKGLIKSITGFDNFLRGNFKKAENHLERAREYALMSGNRFIAILSQSTLADLSLMKGNFPEAEERYKKALKIGLMPSKKYSPAVSDALFGLAGLYLERGDLENFKKYNRQGFSHIKRIGKLWFLLGFLNYVRFYSYLCKYNLADEYIRRAYVLADKFDLMDLDDRIVRIFHLTYLFQKGERDEIENVARKLVNESGKSEVAFINTWENVLLARWYVENEYYENAESLLNKIYDSILKKELNYFKVNADQLSCIIDLKKDNITKALEILEDILRFSQKNGILLTLIEFGQPFMELISMYEKCNPESEYKEFIKKLSWLDNYRKNSRDDILNFTKREKEIISLLQKGYSNKRISSQLHISLNTVKTHVKNIFSKLDVHSRFEAINRLKELNF